MVHFEDTVPWSKVFDLAKDCAGEKAAPADSSEAAIDVINDSLMVKNRFRFFLRSAKQLATCHFGEQVTAATVFLQMKNAVDDDVFERNSRPIIGAIRTSHFACDSRVVDSNHPGLVPPNQEN